MAGNHTLGANAAIMTAPTKENDVSRGSSFQFSRSSSTWRRPRRRASQYHLAGSRQFSGLTGRIVEIGDTVEQIFVVISVGYIAFAPGLKAVCLATIMIGKLL